MLFDRLLPPLLIDHYRILICWRLRKELQDLNTQQSDPANGFNLGLIRNLLLPLIHLQPHFLQIQHLNNNTHKLLFFQAVFIRKYTFYFDREELGDFFYHLKILHLNLINISNFTFTYQHLVYPFDYDVFKDIGALGKLCHGDL